MGFVLLIGVSGLIVGIALALISEFVPDAGGGGHDPRSCRSCQAALPVSALSPIRSGGNTCAACGERPSAARIPVVVATGLLFAAIAWVIGAHWQLVPILFLAASLVALSTVDLVRYRLPDRLVFSSLGISIVLMAVFAFANDSSDHLVRGLITALAYSFLLLIPNIVMPSGLAFGDVKLALLLGLFLGWAADSGIDAARLVVWAFLLGMVFGVFSGLFVGLGRRAFGPGFMPDPDYPPAEDGSLDPLLKTQAPFGPALAFSALGLVVFSAQVLNGASILG